MKITDSQRSCEGNVCESNGGKPPCPSGTSVCVVGSAMLETLYPKQHSAIRRPLSRLHLARIRRPRTFQHPIIVIPKQERRYAMRNTTIAIALALAASSAIAEPIDPSDIRVIDGDTIRVYHQQPNVRLVGFIPSP